MKTRQLLLAFTVGIIFVLTATAQKAEQFVFDGNTYYGTKAIPDEITGLYKYEKTKEPIVEINKDSSGKFQLHGVPEYPVEYWIQTDEKGVIHMRKSEVNKNYQVVLILKYGSNGQAGWKGEKAGQYDRIEVTVAYDQGYAIALGERFKKL
ncbi:MAG: hypothetical protein DI539_18430 [Flavobacterium psychrophilum]|nr:MAG: hypothetical protein DI539_18430 [Flavobacterium psychrophilum]